MNNTQTLNRSLEAITWGALLIWWGITELITSLPNGTIVIGLGLILIIVNVARSRYGVPVNRFSITIGILALVWGGLELLGVLLSLPFELPIFSILLIVLGVIVLVPGLPGRQNQ